jgi:hypothetical protein
MRCNMRVQNPASRLVIRHRQSVPCPILPACYSFFLTVALPEMTGLSLSEQLRIAKAATVRRRAYPFTGPFGQIVAFEFQRSPFISLYLNAEGDFAE